MEQLDKYVYLIAEAEYLKTFNRSGTMSDNEDLYPYNWFDIQDNELKTNILLEAIKKKILISETKVYKTHFEDGKVIL